MEYSPNNKDILIDLLSEYEAMTQRGELSNLDEQSFFKLVSYFENDLRFDAALNIVNHALEFYAYSVDFYNKKTEILLDLKRLDDAKLINDQALSLSPSDIHATLLKARVLAFDQQFQESLFVLDELLISATLQDAIEVLLEKAYVFEMMRDSFKVFDLLSEVLNLDPQNIDALERIWPCTESIKAWTPCINLHKNIIDKDPYSYMAWYNLGLAYSCLGEYEKAIDAFEYSFIINKNFELAYKDCGDLCFELCNYKQALKTYLEAHEVFGADIDLLTNIGQCLIHLNRFKAARKYLTKALNLDPYNDELHYYVGISFSREGRWINAINAYKRALDLDEEREEYFAGLGEAFFHLNEFDKAERYFRKAIKNGPEQSFIWLAYANFLLATDNLPKAVNILDKADFYTQSIDLVYCKAACLFLMDKKSEGLEVLRDALINDYSLHGLLFTFVPYLQFDTDIQSIIKYYKNQ
jgi:tetratricopeptide (TPR) repeat protein